MRRLVLLLLVLLPLPATADAGVNLWSRLVWKVAQQYPLDHGLYTGWGPDWAGAGPFQQLGVSFAKGPVGFQLDTQFSAGGDLDAHVNYAQGWLAPLPSLKLYAGKIRLDDYRWLTDYTDRAMGRFQTPDHWAAAAATWTPLPGLQASLMVPAYVGTESPSHLDASPTGPHDPKNQTAADSWKLTDVAVSWTAKGWRLVAATLGDTTAGGAYGSTGSDLGAGFGNPDPEKSARSWYGGVGWANGAWDAWTAVTAWTAPGDSSERHAQALGQVKFTWGDLRFGVDGVAVYDSTAPDTVTSTQVVSGLSTGANTVDAGPVTFAALAGVSGRTKSGLDLSWSVAVGGGNRDLATGWGTYTLPLYDRFAELRASLTWGPTGLTLGFDGKYDLDAQVTTWVVPVVYTFSSY